MGFDRGPAAAAQAGRVLRLLAAALACAAAGALLVATAASARGLSGAAVLAATGLALAWPLAGARRRGGNGGADLRPTPGDDERAPVLEDSVHHGQALLAETPHRLAVLQAQLEHLPVAAWVQRGDQLQPLSSRARRLAAPGGVRDAQGLFAVLRGATRSGPVVLDTERGSERWQLRRQDLALDGQAQALLVLVPLESELETASLLAWQQLVQVLTHEIMNSLTPIRSLSETAQGLLADLQGQAPAPAQAHAQVRAVAAGSAPTPIDRQALADLHTALDAIARRADSLGRFVATYRRVSQCPPPVLAPVDLGGLWARLQQAVAPAWLARGGQVAFELASPGLRLQADEGQLEQALLALLHNAAQATEGQAQPRLWVQARQSRGGRLQISVRDNGPGVAAGLERQIFLPFFSTRDGGQGIGLNVVRQLVHGMGGRVRHVRPLDGGAAFVLSF